MHACVFPDCWAPCMSRRPSPLPPQVLAANMHGADAEGLRLIRRKYFPNGELDDGGGAVPPLAAGKGGVGGQKALATHSPGRFPRYSCPSPDGFARQAARPTPPHPAPPAPPSPFRRGGVPGRGGGGGGRRGRRGAAAAGRVGGERAARVGAGPGRRACGAGGCAGLGWGWADWPCGGRRSAQSDSLGALLRVKRAVA